MLSLRANAHEPAASVAYVTTGGRCFTSAVVEQMFLRVLVSWVAPVSLPSRSSECYKLKSRQSSTMLLTAHGQRHPVRRVSKAHSATEVNNRPRTTIRTPIAGCRIVQRFGALSAEFSLTDPGARCANNTIQVMQVCHMSFNDGFWLITSPKNCSL